MREQDSLMEMRKSGYQISLSHVALSPYAAQVETETIAWMSKYHLFQEEKHYKRVQAMEIRKYAGYAHPFGSYEDTLLFAKYITLWLLWDDFVIECEADTRAAMIEMREVFDVETERQPSRDNYILAWQSIISDYHTHGASPAFLSRLGANMIAWMDAAAHEKASASQVRRENFLAYLERRIITIGMIPTAQLLELSADVELAETELIRRMVIESAKIVAFANELASVKKDKGWINLVNVYREVNRCSLDEAYHAVVTMHDAAVRQYDALLHELGPGSQEWGRLLQYCAEGFSYWHTVCLRYEGACMGVNFSPAVHDA